jgi:predicted RNA-binding protein associated with RNAse of E/G family
MRTRATAWTTARGRAQWIPATDGLRAVLNGGMSDPSVSVGGTAVARGIFGGRPCYERAMRVLAVDGAAGTVTTARWPGAATRDITSYIESLRTGDAALREDARQAHVRGDWTLADSAWRRTGVVEQVAARRWFSVSAMYGADGAMQCWYVNFERPPLWRDGGWDTHDLALDLVVEPDGTPHWKDEDEYERGRHLGLISDAEHRAVWAARDEALAVVESRGGLFAPGAVASNWLPDPGWALPSLPGHVRESD